MVLKDKNVHVPLMLRKESIQLPQQELKKQDLSKTCSMSIGKIFWNPTKVENNNVFNFVCFSRGTSN